MGHTGAQGGGIQGEDRKLVMAGAEFQWRGWARVGTWHARYRRSWGRPGGEPVKVPGSRRTKHSGPQLWGLSEGGLETNGLQIQALSLVLAKQSASHTFSRAYK